MNFLKSKQMNKLGLNLSKTVLLSMVFIAALGLTSCKNDTKKESESTEMSSDMAANTITFGVRGNCNMCKKTIEKAANSVAGVKNANWDVDEKKIEVSFDGSETDAMAIHKAIAASGYDTDKVASNEAAYNDLPGCCQYDHAMKID
ncbi:cation transporter [Tamlana sp. I1]|uniref:cation transporter n=1 Tax=Tamlana sp. I1 TaxID=2762061 RepID=UPI00188E26DA|nr:cation transporter [Tamlana sp. I1]